VVVDVLAGDFNEPVRKVLHEGCQVRQRLGVLETKTKKEEIKWELNNEC